jgi:hypothetical protein
MKSKNLLTHPLIHLVGYLLVPVLINTLTILHSDKVLPAGGALMLHGGGVLLAINWGPSGLVLCAFLGVLFGLPIAGMQAAYLSSRLARVDKGADARETLRLDPWLGGPWPWLVAALVAMAVGWVWVFPPLGGPLLAVNVLWARTLVYHHEVRVYEYLCADAALRQGDDLPEAGLARAPYSA